MAFESGDFPSILIDGHKLDGEAREIGVCNTPAALLKLVGY